MFSVAGPSWSSAFPGGLINEDLEKPSAFAFLPLAAFAFGEAALVAFAATLAVLFVGEAAAFGFGEDLAGRVVVVSLAGEGSADAFLNELNDFDDAFVGAVGRGDFEGVADFQGRA